MSLTGTARTHEATKTEIAGDGLRYLSRTAGSPFAPLGSAATMSCFFCGKHRARSTLETKKVLGKPQKVCIDKAACKESRRA